MYLMDRRLLLLDAVGMALALGSVGTQAAASVREEALNPGRSGPDEIFYLWPGDAPGMPVQRPVEIETERSKMAGSNDRILTGILRPRVAVFRSARANGASAVIIPGGAYARVGIDKDGYDIARYLAARGVTAFVLSYRLPGEGWKDRDNVPLQDGQRAIRLVRQRAGRYGIDPDRVAVMGFSAGGHLGAELVARSDSRTYDPIDRADRLSARPMLAALLYPVVSMSPPLAHAGSRDMLLGPDPSAALVAAHSPDRHIKGDSPPCFLCAAEDDAIVSVENVVLLHAALRAAKVPVEMHLFTEGDHGFGVRAGSKPAGIWPELFIAWARTRGWFEASTTPIG